MHSDLMEPECDKGLAGGSKGDQPSWAWCWRGVSGIDTHARGAGGPSHLSQLPQEDILGMPGSSSAIVRQAHGRIRQRLHREGVQPCSTWAPFHRLVIASRRDAMRSVWQRVPSKSWVCTISF